MIIWALLIEMAPRKDKDKLCPGCKLIIEPKTSQSNEKHSLILGSKKLQDQKEIAVTRALKLGVICRLNFFVVFLAPRPVAW